MRRAVIAVASASLAFGLWEAATRLAPEADVARWTLGAGSVPMEVSQQAGSLAPRPGVLDLSFYRVAAPRIAPFTDAVIDLVARVPTDGQLLVSLGADAVAGPRQPVKLQAPGGGAAGPNPAGAGPGGVGPGGTGAGPGGVPGGGIPSGGAQFGGGGAGIGGPGTGQTKPPERGVTLLIDRSVQGGIRGRRLTCTPASAPASDEFSLHLDARNGVIALSIDGNPVTRCTGTWSAGSLVIGSGVRRVQVESVRVTPAGVAPFTDTFGGPFHHPVSGLLLTLLGAAAGVGLARRARLAHAIALAPLVAVPFLGRMDLRGVLDALRMLQVPEALGPLLFAGVPVGIALVCVFGGAAATMRSAAASGLAPFAIVAVLAATGVAGMNSLAALCVFAGLGVPLAVLAWINTHPFSRRVGASYALTGLLLLGAEAGLRRSDLDATWQTTAGWKRASTEFAELLEIRKYRTYPDEGFPVKPPAPDPTRKRIVALGGSSTGGAFQMDDLDQFWPKRLGERVGASGWEVVNQGVGGWNTLHIRLYIESQIERLGATIFVLYVGHNDILAPSPVAYRELYARYKSPSGVVSRVSGVLSNLRLYVGLKHALFAVRGAGVAVAVPVPDARENVAAIIATAEAHGARVLLMTEGLNPDPLPMRTYGDMLKDEAATTGNLYFDAAEALRATGDPEVFLDDCHLSADGHAQLAGWALDTMTTAGWLK